MKKTAIIGTGLMGTSFALALMKTDSNVFISGFDCDKENAAAANRLGIENAGTFEEAVKDAQLIVIAVPVNVAAENVVEALKLNKTALITDLSSTKKQITEQVKLQSADFSRFIPAHPMAGTENSGASAAVDGLFENAAVIITPYEETSETSVKQIKDLYLGFGSRIITMDALRHDLSVAYVSHISHISSFALALTVLNKEKNTENITNLAGGGFRSTARLAKSSPAMWAPIFMQNKKAVLDVLDEYSENIALLRGAISSGNEEALKMLIEQANRIKKLV